MTDETAEIDAVTLRVLEAVDRNDVGFRYVGGRTHLHWWLSEHDKRRLTSAERARLFNLLATAHVVAEHAVGAFGRGAYYLTPLGQRMLHKRVFPPGQATADG